jgi:hypothetical protein
MTGWDLSKQSGGYASDPFTCQRCGGHRLTEPTRVKSGYMQTCLDCGRSRMLDPSHPLFNWYGQQTQYPAELQELNQGRPMNMFGKVAMPVDPEWWREQTQPASLEGFDTTGLSQRELDAAQHVPFQTLYHGTRHRNLESILTHGLAPWDHPSVGGSHNYHDMRDMMSGKAWYTPRPQHTYLTNDETRALSLGNNGEDAAVLEIDPSYLHPENINPDEDHYRYHLNERPNPSALPDASLGDYAERTGWGYGDLQEPGQNMMAEHGNVAYRGVIPPQAITHVHHSVNGRWTREPVEHVMQRIQEQRQMVDAHNQAVKEHMHTYTNTREHIARMAWDL